jgi:hypothetical protein
VLGEFAPEDGNNIHCNTKEWSGIRCVSWEIEHYKLFGLIMLGVRCEAKVGGNFLGGPSNLKTGFKP